MSPAVWTGPATVAATLLVVAGVAKSARPDDTWRALATAGFPGGRAAVRAGAAVEAGLGAWALLTGDAAAMALVALSYTGFAAFVTTALRRELPVSSCGCFGEPDVPPTGLHVAIDLAAAGAAVGAAASGAPGVATVLGAQPLAGVPYVTLLALAAATAMLALTRLPHLRAASDLVRGDAR